MPDRSNFLSIYLNDHLAGATFGRELAKRAAGENRGNEYGPPLEGFVGELRDDRATLLAVMETLGIRRDPVKRSAAVTAERVGRLKPNGSLRGYSPLSRLVELEGLLAGVDAKRSMWNVLRVIGEPALASFDFDALSARAAQQHTALSELKQRAGAVAFGSRVAA